MENESEQMLVLYQLKRKYMSLICREIDCSRHILKPCYHAVSLSVALLPSAAIYFFCLVLYFTYSYYYSYSYCDYDYDYFIIIIIHFIIQSFLFIFPYHRCK